MRWKLVGAGVALAAAAGLVAVGEPTLQDRMERLAPEHDAVLESRAVHADPAEVRGLMENIQLRLALLDVRSEADYNLFHLQDARHLPLDRLDAAWLDRLHPETVLVVMSNDERDAEHAWRILRARGLRNLYVLAGGVNGWIDAFCPAVCDPALEVAGWAADEHPPETLHRRFGAALGGRWPLSRPDPHELPPRGFTPVVKPPRPPRALSGGCG